MSPSERPGAPKPLACKIYPRPEHNISRSQISENALKVLYRLKKAGFEAYLVGGCVRDLLLGREPKDFDVATNASPEQVKNTFRNCRLIGRRFRLAHVYFGREIIEVATFRGSDSEDAERQLVHEDGRLLRDNVFGTIEEDVWRRDFTVNSLYYNIRDFSVVDYTGGMEDHGAAILKLIGDPESRYREDPVRMLRAVRFAVKLGFAIHPDTEKPIFDMAELLRSIPAARLFDESLKLFLSGYGLQTFELLRHYGLFAVLFPDSDRCLATEDHDFPRLFVATALQNSDNRIAEGKTVTPYFLLAAFLWEPLQLEVKTQLQQGENETFAYQNAANQVLKRQIKVTSIPKRITQSMREVWLLQSRFSKRVGARPFRLLSHPRFRAAYDFLLLRAQTGDADSELAEWWTQFQRADETEQKRMTRPAKKSRKKRRPKQSRPKSTNTEAT
ncbi:polynucleotide adenylyltransferase PcnB [Methylomarinum sp. Ch1-1]|uniref:Poly(A) polymerase I n=1 Tax=Methylomarinum roseum TaxID=3067653 RepID=A0AAU7NXY1_9GAMM|nr:polynucleotide adenylyltransferase PcnB [Methylomarinum sp. Ch1-1]MDP4522078.1 polynucleotide adenylyltransferase PcnB [Methylomarinum sp. Ch1-1]